MVTLDPAKTLAFTVAITRLTDGTALATLVREDGATRNYKFPVKKLTVVKALDLTAKDAVDFLLGEA